MSTSASRQTIVCACQDVTLGDVEDAIKQGHTNVETIKRATGLFMGACQGKVCSSAVTWLLDSTDDVPSRHASRPRVRVPVQPVLLGNLIDPVDD